MLNVYRMLFLALKKVRTIKITPRQILTIQWKNLSTKISHPPHTWGGDSHLSFSCYLEHPSIFHLSIMICRNSFSIFLSLTDLWLKFNTTNNEMSLKMLLIIRNGFLVPMWKYWISISKNKVLPWLHLEKCVDYFSIQNYVVVSLCFR